MLQDSMYSSIGLTIRRELRSAFNDFQSLEMQKN